MRENQTKTIGSHTYQIQQLPAGQSRRLLTRLLKVMGPPVARLLESLDDDQELGDVDMRSVGAALESLALHVAEDDVEHIFDVMFRSGSVTVKTGDNRWSTVGSEFADVHFAGDVAGMYRLLGFFLEVNYSSFFDGADGLKRVVSRMPTRARSASRSPRPSTGKSGG